MATPEQSALEVVANLGVAATVVAMAFYLFYRLFNRFIDAARTDQKELLETHKIERAEWRGDMERMQRQFTDALGQHAHSTVKALENLVHEIQNQSPGGNDQRIKKTGN